MTQHFVAIGPNGRKIGLVCSSYRKFVRKCRKKLEMKMKEEDIYVTLEDGTEVDDEYFEVLQSGIDLHIKVRREEKSESLHQLAVFLHKCLLNQPKIHDKISECLEKPELAPHILGLLAKVAESSQTPSKKDDDVEWFRGLNTKCRTKEAVMKNSAESRMRGYLEQTKKVLLTDDLPLDSPCRNAVNFFKEQLSKSKYNANYFDRSASCGARLCDGNGLFECEGLYNEPSCENLHTINPYNTREARIVFSTWNLDHGIEKSRSILPLLKSSLEGQSSSSVNLPYFHGLLFLHKCQRGQAVTGNLKLVHVACHDKKMHSAQCNMSLVYANSKVSNAKQNVVSDQSDDATDGVSSQPGKWVGVITRQRIKINRIDCFSDATVVLSPQPHSYAGTTTRRKGKRRNADLYAGNSKKPRIDTRKERVGLRNGY